MSCCQMPSLPTDRHRQDGSEATAFTLQVAWHGPSNQQAGTYEFKHGADATIACTQAGRAVGFALTPGVPPLEVLSIAPRGAVLTRLAFAPQVCCPHVTRHAGCEEQPGLSSAWGSAAAPCH